MLALVYIQSFFIIGTLRALFFELVDTTVFKSRVLVYCAGSQAAFIDTKLRRGVDRRGFDIVGYVSIDDQDTMVDYRKLVTVESSLLDYSRSKMIDEIVVASGPLKSKVKIDELVECKINGIRVVDLLTFFEREAGQIRIDIMDPTWLVTSDGFYQSRNHHHRESKGTRPMIAQHHSSWNSYARDRLAGAAKSEKQYR